MLRSLAVAFLTLAALATPAAARRHAGPARGVTAALRRIEASVDPCGETATVRAVLQKLDACRYEIRTSMTAARNLYDRRAITWNPELRSELEPRCDRDPTA